jgi:phage shock protein A/DNA-binding XRE family transcriptional regulator
VTYLLRMSDEIHDWLADLRRTQPPAAMLTGQALAALMSEGASLGPPMVVPAAATGPQDLLAELDSSYQDRLERLQALRQRAAEATWLVRDIQAQIDELESAQARLEDARRHALADGRDEEAAQDAGRLAAVQRDADQARRLVPWITETEAWLRTRLRRLERRTAAFRTRKELLKAKYTAARAELQVQDELPDPGPADREAATEAAARLRDVTAEIERELGRRPPPEGLLELRPDAPGDGEIRIIFAVQPPGTALLIAVIEGREAARDQYRDAVLLSGEVLVEARAGQAAQASARGYDDVRSFAGEFFPGQAAEVETGAAALAAKNRAHTLAEQRTRLGLTQTEVAERMGVPREQVAAIERADPGTTDVRTLAAYVAALGGRLEITADFAGDRILLRSLGRTVRGSSIPVPASPPVA